MTMMVSVSGEGTLPEETLTAWLRGKKQRTEFGICMRLSLIHISIYKEGQVLTGADVSENGTVFQYENRRQKNAVYNVYAMGPPGRPGEGGVGQVFPEF